MRQFLLHSCFRQQFPRVRSTFRHANILLVLATLTLVPTAGHASPALGGLIFLDDSLHHAWGTTLQVMDGERLSGDACLAVSFDLCIIKPRKFGYVLHGTIGAGVNFDLGFVTYHNRDTAYLDLAFNHQPTAIHVPLLTSALHQPLWYPIEFIFDFRNHRVTGTSPFGTVISDTLIPTGPLPFSLRFGYDGSLSEVPAMMLRNIRVTNTQGNDPLVLHDLPLDETTGGVAADRATGGARDVTHGLWLAETQREWQLITVIDHLTYVNARFAYDPERRRVLFGELDRLLTLSLDDGGIDSLLYRRLRPWRSGTEIWDSRRHRLLAYHEGGGEIAVFDESSRTWSPIDTLVGWQGDSYGHCRIPDSTSGDVFMLGGYGWYEVNNRLKKYSFDTRKWVDVPLTGERWEPCQLAALCATDRPGQYYILGGVGNSSGRQELGYHLYNELWRLELNGFSMHRLWTGPPSNEQDTPSAICQADSGTLFALYGPHVELGGSYQLYRMSTSSAERTPVGNSIHVVSGTPVQLIWEPHTARIIMLLPDSPTKEKYLRVGVYALTFPPMPAVDVDSSRFANMETSGGGWIAPSVLALIACLAVGSGVALRSRRRTILPKEAVVSVGDGAEGVWNHPSHAPAFEVFGALRVCDAKGNDCASLFSPLSRQILLLLIAGGRERKEGAPEVDIERFTSFLWPEADAVRAKNARGAALHNLREQLKSVDGAGIVATRHAYHLDLHGAYCDYFRYLILMRAMVDRDHPPAHELIREFLGIVSPGQFLSGVSFEWLDAVRSAVVSDVESACLAIMVRTDLPDDVILTSAQVLLKWDPISEAALRAEVRVLSTGGHHGLAMAAFEEFRRQYEELVGTEYRGTFAELAEGAGKSDDSVAG